MVGENVRKIRREKGISLSVLAERALVSKSYLSNIERNLKTNPTIDVLLRVSKVLEVDLYDLLDVDRLSLSNELTGVVQLAHEEGITTQQLSEYKILFDFIKWHSQQEN
ncbi:helix-turn-helix domain-containing protein [Alkalihalobacillus sp. CinArs1]|uniref:helix-turn-helix domain-containing protein n=1 Tax=Alkalihalobacillus sp. CinArs1 TaxID=2995314 RepID=UPI0022DD968C|nr:helix-turn-helix transcriptional regulator [Alkalihalobacillus sp. CinArs1]